MGQLTGSTVVAVEPRIINGRPGEDLMTNPTVEIIERRWFEVIREGEFTETKSSTGKVNRVEIGDGTCVDFTEYRIDVYRYRRTRRLERYEDWEFTVPFLQYVGWLQNQSPDQHIELPSSWPVGADGTLDLPRFDVTNLDASRFDTDTPPRLIDSGWTTIDADEPGDSAPTLESQTFKWEPGNPYPCGQPGGSQAVVQVLVVDADTGAPVGGTVAFTGALMVVSLSGGTGPTGPQTPAASVTDPIAINPSGDSPGVDAVVIVGTAITVTHQPAPGYETVRNSRDEVPPGTVHLTPEQADGNYKVVFYDRAITSQQQHQVPPPGEPVPPVAPGTDGPRPMADEGGPGVTPPSQDSAGGDGSLGFTVPGSTNEVVITVDDGVGPPSSVVLSGASGPTTTVPPPESLPANQFQSMPLPSDHPVEIPPVAPEPRRFANPLPCLGAVVILLFCVLGGGFVLYEHTLGATRSTPTVSPRTSTLTSAAPAGNVIIPQNQLNFGTFAESQPICHSGGTLHFSVTLLGIQPGTPVVVQFTGPDVAGTRTYVANPGEPFGENFHIGGGGVWSDTIVSIGGKPPPSAGSTETAPYAC